MKKTWTNPKMEELSIASTEMTNSTGTRVDGGEWDNTTGEITKYYFASGEQGETDYDLNP
jgi:hypothetical protein